MKIRDYYVNEYPSDDMGWEINEDATFNGLSDVLDSPGDYVYEYLWVEDSLVRERVFEKLAEIQDVPYEVIYRKWMSK